MASLPLIWEVHSFFISNSIFYRLSLSISFGNLSNLDNCTPGGGEEPLSFKSEVLIVTSWASYVVDLKSTFLLFNFFFFDTILEKKFFTKQEKLICIITKFNERDRNMDENVIATFSLNFEIRTYFDTNSRFNLAIELFIKKHV